MATIGSLAVNLICKTDKFSSGISKARKDLRGFGAATSAASKGLAMFGGVLAGVLTVSKLKQQAEGLDKLAKSAEKVGVSFEAMQRLRQSSIISDVSENTLTRGLLEMQKRLEEGHKGFQRLGLDIRQLQQMEGEQVFLKIADAIAAMPRGKKRISAARGVFGKPGTDLLPLLAGGSAGIAAGAEGASTFSAMDAAKVDAANDAIDKFTLAIEKLGRELVVALGPTLTKLANFATENVTAVKRFTMGTRDEQKARATEYIKSLSDKNFADYIRVNSDLSGPLQLAVADRINKANEQKAADQKQSIRAVAEGPARIAGDLMGRFTKLAGDGADALGKVGGKVRELEKGTFAAATRQMFGLGPFKAVRGADPLGPGLADDEMLARIKKLGIGAGAGPEMRGNAALERGTAAAFSQERRSAQQNQLVETAKKQLDVARETLTAVKNLKGKDLGAVLLPANLGATV